MRRLVTIIYLLTAVLLANAQRVVIEGSDTVFEAIVGQYSFTKPTVVVRDGNHDVSSQFYLNYYIKGQEQNTIVHDNKTSTQNPVTGTYVSTLYGIVTIGSKAGYDTIRVVARPRTGSTYSQCESQYVIHIPKVQPYVVLSQDSFYVHTNQLFDYPSAKLYRVDNGDTTDITSRFDVSYDHSSGIGDYSEWWLLGHPMMRAPSEVKDGETITMTYVPKPDYADAYESYVKTYRVKVYEYTSSDPMPTTVEWPDGKFLTAVNSARIPIRRPVVRDKYGNDVSRLVKYKYEGIGNTSQVFTELASENGDLYGTWMIHFAYQTNDSANIRMYTYPLGQDDGDPVEYQTGQVDTLIVQGRRLQWQLRVEPATFNMYEGTLTLTPETWKMPNFIATNPAGEETTGGFNRRIGIPVGATLSGNHNTSATGDTVTYRGVKYVMYYAENYTFPIGQWYNWKIDFNNPSLLTTLQENNAPFLIFQIFVYNAGQEEQKHEFLNYNVVVRDKINTTLRLSQTRLSCNINASTKSMIGFSEPTATVYNTNGVGVTNRFNLHYEIEDSSTVKSDFTINASTGELTYKGDGTTNGKLYVHVTATVKDDYKERYNEPNDAVYELTVKPTTFSYELITAYDEPDSTKYGKLHFTGAGTMAAGTVFNDMAGLSVQLGASGDADWVFKESDGAEYDKEGSYTGTADKHLVYTDGTAVELDDNEIPIAGTFAILRPSVNGFLTIDGRWSNKNRYRVIDVENGRITETTDFLNTYGRDILGETYMWKALIAGHTYYLYNYGADDGTYEMTHLHGLNFEPAFIANVTDHYPDRDATSFVNGYTGALNWLLTDATNGVSFEALRAPGTKDTVTVSNYVAIDSRTGNVTPLRSTAKTSVDGYNGVDKDKLMIRATVTNSAATVTKYPYYYLFITDIPSYIMENGETPSVGEKVSTENYPTKITMTFGGWANGFGPYQDSNGNNLIDSWTTAKTDTVGQNDMTIDGFHFASQGRNNPLDEDGNSFNYRISKDSHTPFEMPCRGAYLKFDPEEDGTLIVYILQNGILDYTGSRTWEDLNDGKAYQLKYRPLFILDEAAKEVKLDDKWVIDESLLPSNSTQATHAGSYTEGQYRCAWNDEWVDSTLKARNVKIDYTSPKYTGCPFDMRNYRDRYRSADLDSIMTYWRQYDGTAATARQEIIHLSQGYTLVSKAFVRYTFQVKAGKSYFIFMRGSKLSPCGFSFVPRYFNETPPAKTTVQLSDDDNFEDVYNEQTSMMSQKVDLQDINVKLGRQFGRNKWTGICLPFSISDNKFREVFGNDASIITYDSISPTDSTAYFTQHVYHNIVAGRPYFICPSQNVADTVTIKDVTVEYDRRTAMNTEDSFGQYASTGIFAPESAPMGSYVFAGNSIYHLQREQRLGAYRTYLKPLTADAKPIARMSMGAKKNNENNPVTGIRVLMKDDGMPSANNGGRWMKGVYNLAGQKVADHMDDSLPQGVYIVDGKKVSKDK